MEDGDSWLERLAAGDLSAAENLWLEFFRRIHAYAEARLRKLPPGIGDADDITASVFKSICRMVQNRAIPSVRDPEQLWPLFATIAARKVARLVRRARPNQTGKQIRSTDLDALYVSYEEVPILGGILGREPSPELLEAMRDLWAAVLQRLDRTQTNDQKLRIVAESWLEGRTVAEIASLTSLSERSVFRKLALIRRHIQELGVDSQES